MAASDLCTLADAQAWIGSAATGNDALLKGLITSISRVIYAYVNRGTFLPTAYTETRDGPGGDRFMLAEYPVIAVKSLTLNGCAILPAANPPYGPGYMLDIGTPYPPGNMGSIVLANGRFSRGRLNVAVSYTAGYQVTAEAGVIPGTPFQVTAAAPFGNWATDGGATFADGTPLVAVAANPAQGQYSVVAGLYTFAAADTGKGVLLTYGYIPADIRQAVIEEIAERFSYRQRIGVSSKTLASQETIAYSLKDMPDALKLMLSQYRRVVAP